MVNYGIPDFSHLTPQNLEDHKILSRDLARTIAAYEPRLQDIHVIIEEYNKDKKSLIARINALIVVESIREAVSFPFMIQLKDRDFDLNATR